MAKQLLSILLVEDDELSALSLTSLLSIYGVVQWEKTLKNAQSALLNECFDLALLDLDLEKEKAGLELIAPLSSKGTYVVVLSARREETVVEKAYQCGCRDFLSKPFNREGIEKIFHKEKALRTKSQWQKKWREQFASNDSELIEEMEKAFGALSTNRPLLITGETGTGKTALAKFIHQMIAPQSSFVHLNCAEIPEHLIEAELFGYHKGAFTGALKNKKGLLQLADNGILFLDEIATMPLITQKKLLKAIEEKSFYPLGSEQTVESHFRLISATCENLKDKIANNQFRSDFYYRIEGINLYLKPLRQRRADILTLIDHFMKPGDRRIVFEAQAKELLENYSWPGNVRQLQKVVELLQSQTSGIVSASALESLIPSEHQLDHVDESDFHFNQSEILTHGLKVYLEKIETQIVEKIYKQNQMKVRKTLTDLKISNNAFYRILSRSTFSSRKKDEFRNS